MERKTLIGRLEVKLAPNGSATAIKTFTGYGARFNNTDSYGDIIQPGAFTKTLAAHKAAGTSPIMLWNHDSFAMPIGVWNELAEDTKGLLVSGTFADTSAGNDVHTLAKAGAVTGLSIGFIVTASEIINKNNRLITEVELLEVSVVNFPANGLAQISDVKSENERMNIEIKTILDELKALAEKNAADLAEIKAKMSVKDDGQDEDCDCESDDDCDCEDELSAETDEETKYNEAAISAVQTLSLKLQQEYNGR